jgi:hypothetical protein
MSRQLGSPTPEHHAADAFGTDQLDRLVERGPSQATASPYQRRRQSDRAWMRAIVVGALTVLAAPFPAATVSHAL